MTKLKIKNIDSYLYELEDSKNNKYILNLEFLDLEEKIKINDSIILNEKLLDNKYEGFSTSYTFGNLSSEYGKKDILLTDIDVVKVIIDDKEIYLKRLYG